MLLETRTLPFSAVRQRRSDFFEVILILFVCFSVCVTRQFYDSQGLFQCAEQYPKEGFYIL